MTAPAHLHETLPACLRHGLGSPSRFILPDMEDRGILVNHHRHAGGAVIGPLSSSQHPSFPAACFSHAQAHSALDDPFLLSQPVGPGESLGAAACASTSAGRGQARRSSNSSSSPLAAMAPPPPPEEPQWLLPRGISMDIGGVDARMKLLEPRTRVVPVREVPCGAEDEAASPTEPGKVSALDSPQQGLGSLEGLVDRDSGADHPRPGPDHSVPQFPEEAGPGGVPEAQQAVRLGVEMGEGEPQGGCASAHCREPGNQHKVDGSQLTLLSKDDVELLSAVAPDLLPGAGCAHPGRQDSREASGHCTCGCVGGRVATALPISRSLPPLPPAPTFTPLTTWRGPLGCLPESRSSEALPAVREKTQGGKVEEEEGEGEGGKGRPRVAGPHEAAAVASSPGQGLGMEVEISLVSLRGYSQGVSDVIGALDFDPTGAFFATGGIARKVRVYSMATLAARKAELVSSLEERRSKSSGEDPAGDAEGGPLEEGLEDEGDSGEGVPHADLRHWEWSKRRRRSSCELSGAGVAGGPGAFAGAGAGVGCGTGSVPFFMREGNGGLRRKHKASSTGNLEDLFQQACQQRVREHFLDADACASHMICTAAKLSSLQWVPGKPGVVGCGDYDGVFTEWDLETGMCSSERDEHQGQKIWSIRYSPDQASGLAATASEDGTVKLWSAGSEDCIASILPSPGSAACAVDFSSDGRSLVTGGANSSLFLYDLRSLAAPLAVLQGHERTVSYCRFLNNTTVVSSSIDSTVKVWNVASAMDSGSGSAGAAPHKRRALAPAGSGGDHTNTRNFAGLAVRGDGLIFTGSETNEMVAYRARPGVMGSHMRMDFATGQCSTAPKSDCPPSLGRKPFVSAMNWQGTAGTHLGAANSEGIIRIMRIL